MFKAFQMNSLAGAAMNDKPGQDREATLPNGLVTGHAYSILDAFELISGNNGVYDSLRRSYTIKPSPNDIRLLKLRNPWGNKEAYSGPWSEKSPEWNKVSGNIKKELNNQEDGEFFMLFKDFLDYFDDIDFVHVNLNAFYVVGQEYNMDINWMNKNYFGSWVKGKTAGGTYFITFLNRQ